MVSITFEPIVERLPLGLIQECLMSDPDDVLSLGVKFGGQKPLGNEFFDQRSRRGIRSNSSNAAGMLVGMTFSPEPTSTSRLETRGKAAWARIECGEGRFGPIAQCLRPVLPSPCNLNGLVAVGEPAWPSCRVRRE